MKEIWKTLADYQDYQISNKGRIRSLIKNKKRILKIQKDSDGYCVIIIKTKNSYKNYIISRLVASYFIENPLNKKEVNHKNGNKLNNKVNNLEWVTHAENMKHARKTGLWNGNIKIKK